MQKTEKMGMGALIPSMRCRTRGSAAWDARNFRGLPGQKLAFGCRPPNFPKSKTIIRKASRHCTLSGRQQEWLESSSPRIHAFNHVSNRSNGLPSPSRALSHWSLLSTRTGSSAPGAYLWQHLADGQHLSVPHRPDQLYRVEAHAGVDPSLPVCAVGVVCCSGQRPGQDIGVADLGDDQKRCRRRLRRPS